MSVIRGQLSSSTTWSRSWPHTLLLRCLIPSSVISSQCERLCSIQDYKHTKEKVPCNYNFLKKIFLVIFQTLFIYIYHARTHIQNRMHSPGPGAEGSGLKVEPVCCQWPAKSHKIQNTKLKKSLSTSQRSYHRNKDFSKQKKKKKYISLYGTHSLTHACTPSLHVLLMNPQLIGVFLPHYYGSYFTPGTKHCQVWCKCLVWDLSFSHPALMLFK